MPDLKFLKSRKPVVKEEEEEEEKAGYTSFWERFTKKRSSGSQQLPDETEETPDNEDFTNGLLEEDGEDFGNNLLD